MKKISIDEKKMTLKSRRNMISRKKITLNGVRKKKRGQEIKFMRKRKWT